MRFASIGKSLRCLIYMDGWYTSRASFVDLLIAAADFYITNPTMPTAFHTISFFRFGKQLVQKLGDLYDEFNE